MTAINGVAVAGIGETGYYKRGTAPYGALGLCVQAILAACEDAGIDPHEVDGFCSHGDDITPPQQALDWILDLYDDVEEIRSYGQTLVYTVHVNVGHLGIFVSGGVARKEHSEFSSNIDLIETRVDTLRSGRQHRHILPADGHGDGFRAA